MPAIHFPGNCLEAMTFYEEIFCISEKQVDFYRNAPSDSEINITEDMKNQVMHATMIINGTNSNSFGEIKWQLIS